MAKIYLTPEELSTRWKLPLATLDHWRWNGKPPQFSKMGKRIRYELTDVEAFEDQIVKKNTCYQKYDIPLNIKIRK